MTGSGVIGDPYVIWDVNDLQNINLDITAYYELGQDIDATVTAGWNGGAGFLPIGLWPVVFTGSFDGKGYSITNLTINRPGTNDQALFSNTDATGHVRNVTLINPSVTGRDFTGSVIAYCLNSQTYSDIHVSGGSVHGDDHTGGVVGIIVGGHPIFNDCTCSASVSATGARIGGFVGGIWDTTVFNRCGATGNVSVTNGFNIGGFVGECSNNCSFNQCYATGNVTGTGAGDQYGGFVGLDADGTFTDCYALGNVSTNGQWVGGFAGIVWDLHNCYSAGSVSGGGWVGGLCADSNNVTNSFWDVETSGQTTSAGGTGKTTEEMNHRELYIAAGWDLATVWNISQVTTGLSTNITPGSANLNGLLDLTIINDAYPFLRWQTVVELPCDCGFEWGETELFGNITPVNSKNTGQTFGQALAGLKPNTKHYFRALASSSPGPIHGGIGTFTTLALPALEVETLPATNITENSARIWGRVRKVPITAMAKFDWGGDIGYGDQTPWVPRLVSDDMFYHDLANLAEGRAYHFRAMAMGSALVYGNDMTFTTRSPLGPVTLIQEELANIMEVS